MYLANSRDKIERIGGFVNIDAMKRNLADINWPYMSIFMYNELSSPCVLNVKE